MISRIIKIEVQCRGYQPKPTPGLQLITLTKTLIILDITKTESNCFIIHWTNPFFLASPWKVFTVCANSFFSSSSLSFFSFTYNQQTAALPPLLTFSCSHVQLFFRCLARSTKQTWKSSFFFFTDGKQHKACELVMITLRNHAPWSYMTWSPVILSVLDMIIV